MKTRMVGLGALVGLALLGGAATAAAGEPTGGTESGVVAVAQASAQPSPPTTSSHPTKPSPPTTSSHPTKPSPPTKSSPPVKPAPPRHQVSRVPRGAAGTGDGTYLGAADQTGLGWLTSLGVGAVLSGGLVGAAVAGRRWWARR